MHRLSALPFDNSYVRLHPACYQVVEPTPLPEPSLLAFNPDAAALLGLDPREAEAPEAALYLSGNRRLPGAEPIAQAYGGHQFGVWVPQLGDGRAVLLGEVQGPGGAWDLHLKGGGRTRFSRFGDGRSVLRSTVREYLASEAMHGLGIPTTRALAMVGSPERVQREQVETAATLLRLSPSHVRFGTFQYFTARGELERVRELADYVVQRHFPALAGAGPLQLFAEMVRRTATLLAQWMAAGFAHGVMNTDNMSVLGLTLDYGPYGFLDEYDAGFIGNHTDTGGRYAYDQQPAVGMWNCARFGEALLPIDGAPMEAWQTELERYWALFADAYRRLMLARLGLTERSTDTGDLSEDAGLLSDLLGVLQAERLDYTNSFRSLCEFRTEGPSPADGAASEAMRAWLARYAARLRAEGSVDAERAARMRRVNPKYVLRNWIAQEAIEQAQAGRCGLIEELRRLFADPFAEHPALARFAEPPTGAAREIAVSCSS